MTVLSVTDLNVLRDNHPHVIRPYVSIIVPEVVYCGQVAGSVSFGLRTLTVIDVSGDLSDIEAGMTMFVGTSCGSKSKSKRRVRSTGVGTITVDENTVDWDLGDYVTVYRNWEFWGIFQYINPSGYTFYKDRDISYTDQNDEPDPVAIMGWHRAAFLDGPTVTLQYDASSSYAIADGAGISTYLWECTGAVVGSPNAAATDITFNAYGTYWVKLTVTDSNGKSQVTRRVARIHSRSGSDAPYLDVEFQGTPSGDWEGGGWNASLIVRGVADRSQIPDDALVIIWAEQWYKGTEYYINNTNTLMVGYIERDTIRKTLDTGEIAFDMYTVNRLMSNTVMRSVSLEYKGNPGKWYQYKDLTATRAIHHLLRWHSTLLSIADVILPQDDDELLKACDDFTDGSIYSSIDTFARSHGIFAHACCDKYGRFHVARDIQFYDEADRAAQTVAFEIEDKDRVGENEIEVVRNTTIRLAYAIVSGTHYTGSGKPTPIISQAPGELPHPRGDTETTYDRVVMESQAYGNMVVGRVVALANREIEEIRIPMAGNYLGAVDVVPQEWITLPTISNKRDVSLQGRYVCRAISTDYQSGALKVDIILEPEAFGPDGIPGPYPPGIDAPKDPDPPTEPAWSSALTTVMGMVLVDHGVLPASYNAYIPVLCTNFDNANPLWNGLIKFSVPGSGFVWGAPVDHDFGMFDLHSTGVAYGIIDGAFYRMSSVNALAAWDLKYTKTWPQDTGNCGVNNFIWLTVDPANAARVALIDQCDVIYYTSDSGDLLSTGYTGFRDDPDNPTFLNMWYTGSGYILAMFRKLGPTRIVIYRSTDNGANFSLLHTINVTGSWTSITNALGRCLYNSNLIAFGFDSGPDIFYYTPDGGTTLGTKLTMSGGTEVARGAFMWGTSELQSVHAYGSFGNVQLWYSSDGQLTFTDITPGGTLTDVDWLMYTGSYDNGWLVFVEGGTIYHVKPVGGYAVIKSYNLSATVEDILDPSPVQSYNDMRLYPA